MAVPLTYIRRAGRALAALWRSGAGLCAQLLQRAARHRLTLHAGALAYTTLLALVPGATVVFVFAAKLNPEDAANLIRNLAQFFPYSPAQVQSSLLTFAQRMGALGTVSVVLAFLAALAALVQIEQAFLVIAETDQRRRWLRFAGFVVLLTLGPLVLVGVFTLQASVVLPKPNFLSGPLRSLSQTLVIFGGLTALYRLLPPTPVSFLAATLGAGVATILNSLLATVVKLYLHFIPQLNVIYGSLSLFLVFLTSLMLFWLVVLLGAEVALLVQKRAGEP